MDSAPPDHAAPVPTPGCYRLARKRWGIDLAVLMGTGLMLYTVAVGYGYRLAASQLADSTAALAAMAPPEIPAERNAALVLEQAERDKVWVPWSKVQTEAERDRDDCGQNDLPTDPMQYFSEQLKKSEVYEKGSPLRRLLAANTKALEIAHRAAALPECRWTFDWSRGMQTNWPPLGAPRSLARGLCLHAILAAHDGRWQDAQQDIASIVALAQDFRHGPGLTCSLVADTMEATGRDALQRMLWFTPVNTETYEGIDTLMTRARARPDSIPFFFAFENKAAGMMMDLLGSGDRNAWKAFAAASIFDSRHDRGFSTLLRWCDPSEIPEPWAFYAAVYPWDRACFADVLRLEPTETAESLMQKHPTYRYLEACRMPVAAKWILPARDLVVRLSRECYAGWDLARIGLRLSKWGHDHGHLPTDLNEAGLTADEQHDPYDPTRSLHWRRSDNCRQGVLWNFGKNNRDDTDGRIDGAHGDDRTWVVVLPEVTP